jgi:hypothetical protein
MTQTAKLAFWFGVAGAALLGLFCAVWFLLILPSLVPRPRPPATRRQLNILWLALSAYDDRFGALPPSDPRQVARCGDETVQIGPGYAGTGAEALCFFLRGWYIDNGQVVRGVKYKVKNVTGNWDEVKPFYTPDEDEQFPSNHPRYGFGGAQYGQFFGDRFDNHRPILYFKANPSRPGNPFSQADNAAILERWKAPNPRPVDRFLMDGGQPRYTQFVLWSTGPDGLYLSDDDIVVGQ